MVYLVYLRLDASHQLICLVLVEFQDALHLDLQQFEDILFGDLTDHLRIIRCQSLVDMFTDGIDSRCLFEFLILIDTLLDEDFLQGIEMQLLQEFILSDLQFLSDEAFGTIHPMAQHVGYSQELWLVIFDDAAVRRNVDLTV